MATFWNQSIDKGRLKQFVLWFLEQHGGQKTTELLDKLKHLGFHSATRSGISLGIDDLKIPPTKSFLLAQAEWEGVGVSLNTERGSLTGIERFQRLIQTWNQTSEWLKQEVVQHFETTNVLNPVYLMAFSGARGNISQVRQLVGMRGLMADPQGQVLDFPIRSNFREGLTLTEYIISCYGARKGIVDTALRTANAGYLTRRLVDVAQHVIVCHVDCDTRRGVVFSNLTDGKKTLASLEQRLVGRVLGRDVWQGSRLLGERNQEVSRSLAKELSKSCKKVFVRSPLTCEIRYGVCQRCYGWNLAQGRLVSLGEAVGVLAAQSIGEPGTQLTMRTFHTGGAFSGDAVEQIKAPFDGQVILYPAVPGRLVRTTEGRIVFCLKEQGKIKVEFQNQKKAATFVLPAYGLLFVRQGQYVYRQQTLAQFTSMQTPLAARSTLQQEGEQAVSSPLEGEFYAPGLNVTHEMSMYSPDLTVRAKGGTSVWMLSGKVYDWPSGKGQWVNNGDYVTQNAPIQTLAWYLPSPSSVSYAHTLGCDLRSWLRQPEAHRTHMLDVTPSFLQMAPKVRKRGKGVATYGMQGINGVKKSILRLPVVRFFYKSVGYVGYSMNQKWFLPTSLVSKKEFVHLQWAFSCQQMVKKKRKSPPFLPIGQLLPPIRWSIAKSVWLPSQHLDFCFQTNRQGKTDVRLCSLHAIQGLLISESALALALSKNNNVGAVTINLNPRHIPIKPVSLLHFCGQLPPFVFFGKQFEQPLRAYRRKSDQVGQVVGLQTTNYHRFPNTRPFREEEDFPVSKMGSVLHAGSLDANHFRISDKGEIHKTKVASLDSIAVSRRQKLTTSQSEICGADSGWVFYPKVTASALKLHRTWVNLNETSTNGVVDLNLTNQRTYLEWMPSQTSQWQWPSGLQILHNPGARYKPFFANTRTTGDFKFALRLRPIQPLNEASTVVAKTQLLSDTSELTIYRHWLEENQRLLEQHIRSAPKKDSWLSYKEGCFSLYNTQKAPIQFFGGDVFCKSDDSHTVHLDARPWQLSYNLLEGGFRDLVASLPENSFSLAAKPSSLFWTEVHGQLEGGYLDLVKKAQPDITVPLSEKSKIRYLQPKVGTFGSEAGTAGDTLGRRSSTLWAQTESVSPVSGEWLRSTNLQPPRSLILSRHHQASFYHHVAWKMALATKVDTLVDGTVDPFVLQRNILTLAANTEALKIGPPFAKSKNPTQFLKTLGDFVKRGDRGPVFLAPKVSKGESEAGNYAFPTNGQIIHVGLEKVTLRRGKPIRLPNRAILHAFHKDLLYNQVQMVTLPFQRLEAGDIVQGIPKIEQYFEARTTRNGRNFRESIPTLLKALYDRAQREKSFAALSDQGFISATTSALATRQALAKIQRILVYGVQRVYRSQGVSISEKHIEVIVRQMTDRARVIKGSGTGIFRGESVQVAWLEYVNSRLRYPIVYVPMVRGITRAALETYSFLSAASFQQSTKVLSRAALETRTEYLRGLKQNVMLGNLMPAGSGFWRQEVKQVASQPFVAPKVISSRTPWSVFIPFFNVHTWLRS